MAPTFRSTVGGMRMSKLAAISEGTTLKETPPSSMVRLSEVTSPRVRLESDLSLGGRKGESTSTTQGGGECSPTPPVPPNVETEAWSGSAGSEPGSGSQRPPPRTELKPQPFPLPVSYLCFSLSLKARKELMTLCWGRKGSG